MVEILLSVGAAGVPVIVVLLGLTLSEQRKLAAQLDALAHMVFRLDPDSPRNERYVRDPTLPLSKVDTMPRAFQRQEHILNGRHRRR